MNDAQLQTYLADVRSNAAQHGLTMYPGLPYRGQAFRELLYEGELHQFISLAIVARTHFLYLDTRNLEIDNDIRNQSPFQTSREEDGSDSAFAIALYNDALEAWRSHDGHLHTVDVTFVIEGVCHRKRASADWYAGYEQVLADAGDRLNRQIARQRRGVWAQRIEALLNDPRFPLARNERQRIRLATELNPDMTQPASSLVADALSEIWLREVSESTGTPLNRD
jgi:hypothetical protein